MAVARRDVTMSVPWSGLVRMLSSEEPPVGNAQTALASLPSRPTRPRTDDLYSTGKRLSGLDSKPPPWQDMCAVYRVVTGCEGTGARDGAGSRAGRASRCPQGTVQAWAPRGTWEAFGPTQKGSRYRLGWPCISREPWGLFARELCDPA
eukprot:scaffold10944_cov41-Phaeocystis_antarctica.AAC.2